MRSVPRTRHQVSPRAVRALSPFFRQSYGRDAYVLRGVGNRWGPVLQVRQTSAQPTPSSEAEGEQPMA